MITPPSSSLRLLIFSCVISPMILVTFPSWDLTAYWMVVALLVVVILTLFDGVSRLNGSLLFTHVLLLFWWIMSAET